MTDAPFKVYGFGLSTCTQKVLMTLKEKDLPYELIIVDLPHGEHKTSAYLERHPFGKIPALEDSTGFVVYESIAISRYLDNLTPAKNRLVPADPKVAALTDQWVSCCTSYFQPHAGPIIFERAVKPFLGLTTDESLVEEQRSKLIPTLDIYEKHLSTSDYFAGNEFTLADLVHLPFVNVLQRVDNALIEERPNFKAWFQRVSSRPSWKAIVKEHLKK